MEIQVFSCRVKVEYRCAVITNCVGYNAAFWGLKRFIKDVDQVLFTQEHGKEMVSDVFIILHCRNRDMFRRYRTNTQGDELYAE